MYFIPDGTTRCGLYECQACHYRFLSILTEDRIACSACEMGYDPDLGPCEEISPVARTARLLAVLEGEEVAAADQAMKQTPGEKK